MALTKTLAVRGAHADAKQYVRDYVVYSYVDFQGNEQWTYCPLTDWKRFAIVGGDENTRTAHTVAGWRTGTFGIRINDYTDTRDILRFLDRY